MKARWPIPESRRRGSRGDAMLEFAFFILPTANTNIAIDNLTDNAANFARASRYLPNGSTSYGGNVIFVVGLGGMAV